MMLTQTRRLKQLSVVNLWVPSRNRAGFGLLFSGQLSLEHPACQEEGQTLCQTHSIPASNLKLGSLSVLCTLSFLFPEPSCCLSHTPSFPTFFFFYSCEAANRMYTTSIRSTSRRTLHDQKVH